MDYMLKSNDKRIVINDFIQGEPLSEENLDRTLELVTNLRKFEYENPVKSKVSEDENANEIRLLFGDSKSIWIYTGYYWEEIYEPYFTDQTQEYIDNYLKHYEIRKHIISQCDVLIDGRYVDSQKDISLKWRGSSNQRVIDVRKSLEKKEVILYCD